MQIIGDSNIPNNVVYIIGDSIKRDVYPALEIGATGIWAKYGLNWEGKNRETIEKITTYSENKVDIVSTKEYKNFVIAESFRDIQQIIIHPPQEMLPGFSL